MLGAGLRPGDAVTDALGGDVAVVTAASAFATGDGLVKAGVATGAHAAMKTTATAARRMARGV